MSTDVTTPDTPAAARNGVHPPTAARPELPHPELFEYEPEGIGPLSDELKASLADAKWIDEELYAGRLREYYGKCIAVVGRQVVGVGDSQWELADQVAERLGVLACRVAVSLID